MVERLSDRLTLFRDTGNVYVLQDGPRGLLIDFGSGRVLDHLPNLGVRQVDGILHTHHHRDQCQSDALANRQAIPVLVPFHERPYFDEVETLWSARQVYNMYNVRQTFHTLARSVRVDRSLRDYETFAWGPFRLRVQPTPGHTLGHIALVGEIDGRVVAFTGDLFESPGRVRALYDLQYAYGSHDGCDHLIYSLGKLRDLGVALACPSHGDPFTNVDESARALEDRLRGYLRRHWGVETPSADVAPRAVLPHLIQIPGCSNTWIVVSDSGKALFVDYGSQNWTLFHSFQVYFEAANRLRMLEHNLDLLRAGFGVRQIDLALPSHYHDDHINGLPYLQKHCGTRVWCYHNMRDILENPHGYKLGCTHFEPVRVERALEQGETFQWEEYAFQVFHAPGHADYHMAMFGEIDGVRVAFTGDEVNLLPDGRPCSNNIWRNHVHANSHEITGRLFLERQPELACPGHGDPLRLRAEQWRAFHAWCMEEQADWRALAAPEWLEDALYPDSVFLYPYQPSCPPGASAPMQVWYENRRDRPSTLAWTLVMPDGWTGAPDQGLLTVAPEQRGIDRFVLSIPAEQTVIHRRLPFTLDATIDGERCGEVAEALVDLRPAP